MQYHCRPCGGSSLSLAHYSLGWPKQDFWLQCVRLRLPKNCASSQLLCVHLNSTSNFFSVKFLSTVKVHAFASLADSSFSWLDLILSLLVTAHGDAFSPFMFLFQFLLLELFLLFPFYSTALLTFPQLLHLLE